MSAVVVVHLIVKLGTIYNLNFYFKRSSEFDNESVLLRPENIHNLNIADILLINQLFSFENLQWPIPIV